MDEEMSTHIANNTFTWVERPHGRVKILTNSWIFSNKHNELGEIVQNKARLVVHGNRQGDMSLQETYAPTIATETIRITLSLGAAHDREIKTIDFKSAFLNAELEEEVYTYQPKGYEDGTNNVLRINKAMFGLRQSPKHWNDHVVEYFTTLGFSQSPANPCLLVKGKGEDMIWIGLHVDDGLLVAWKGDLLVGLENQIETEYKIKRNGDIKLYLGMNVQRDRQKRILALSQPSYIDEIIAKCQVQQANPSKLPMDSSPKFLDDEPMDKKKFMELIGLLLYLARMTRPDIMAPVNILAQNTQNPYMSHYNAGLRIVKYLMGTRKSALVLGGASNSNDVLEAWVDSNWNGPAGKSRTGYVIKVAQGTPVFASKLQTVVAQSTSEAEYVALAAVTKDILWVLAILDSLQVEYHLPVKVHEDNEGCKLIAENQLLTPRSRHIDVRFHFLRYHVKHKNIQLLYTPTKNMVADFLTKPVDIEKLGWCCNASRVIPPWKGVDHTATPL
ncbi:DNA-directed DNA polymerase [Synchytrium endobioticum]|uniref:DNA-directed DNA polymerase n=1 Tax=Synchytrium endobioticum TaxID=286115 RepID=A0A507BRJ8_9FUNG|nr:DNA-directed DNA polymerase [Synchytrium endobioticum]